MSSFVQGQASFNQNFKVGKASALDARMLAPDLANLTSNEIEFKYKGMIVSIFNDENRSGGSSDNNGLYILTGTDSTQLSSWTKVGSGELPTPASGDANKVLTVNSSEDGYILSDVPDELPTPASGDANKVLTVNSSEDGYTLSDIPDQLPTITGSNDVGASVVVNSNYNGYQLTKLAIPTDNSSLTNGAGYITSSDLPASSELLPTVVSADSGKLLKVKSVGGGFELFSQPKFATSTSADRSKYIQVDSSDENRLVYTSLTIPTDNSELGNGAGYITLSEVPDQLPTISGSNDVGASVVVNSNYNGYQLTKLAIPTDNSSLTNGAGYITSSSLPSSNQLLPTVVSADSGKLLTVKSVGGGFELFSQPKFPTAVSADKGKFVKVSTTDESRLSYQAVTIPTNNNQLTNGAGYITSSSIPTNNNQLTNGAGYITSSSLPTSNQQLTNGAGYLTSSDVPLPGSISAGNVGKILKVNLQSVYELVDPPPVLPTTSGAAIGMSVIVNSSGTGYTLNTPTSGFTNHYFSGRVNQTTSQNLNQGSIIIKYGGNYSDGFLSHTANADRWTIKKRGLWTISVFIRSIQGNVNDRMLHYLRLTKRPNTPSDYNNEGAVVYNLGASYYRDDDNLFDDTVLSGTATTLFDVDDTVETTVSRSYLQRSNQSSSTNMTYTANTYISFECLYA